MLLYVFAVILFAIVKKDNVYLALNDNMDSNIPIYKNDKRQWVVLEI